MTIQCLSDLFNRDNYKIDSLIRLSMHFLRTELNERILLLVLP